MTKPFLKIAREVILKKSPQILTGIGIAGIYATAYLASKETLKAAKMIEEEGLTSRKDIFKRTLPLYVPSIITSLISSLCVIKSGRIYNARNAATLALYSMTDQAFKTYSEKVRQTIGDGKETKIRDAVVKDRIDATYQTKDVIITGNGDVLCYDLPSDRYFKSNVEKVKRKENEFNMRLRQEMVLSVSELYFDLGLEPTKLGDNLGWDIDKGQILTFRYSSHLTEDQQPCLVIDYEAYPIY